MFVEAEQCQGAARSSRPVIDESGAQELGASVEPQAPNVRAARKSANLRVAEVEKRVGRVVEVAVVATRKLLEAGTVVP